MGKQREEIFFTSLSFIFVTGVKKVSHYPAFLLYSDW